MKLFYSPGACSLASQIVLKEVGHPYTPEKVDLKSHTFRGDKDFYLVNPKGRVPALELDDGSLLTENVAVLQYLADLNPACHLAPANGTVERYRLQEWLGFINSEIHKSFGPLFKEGTEKEKRQAVEKLQTGFDYIEGTLAGKTFLTGSQFTVADAYLYVMLKWAERMEISLSRWPRLTAVKLLVRDKPSVQLAESEESDS